MGETAELLLIKSDFYLQCLLLLFAKQELTSACSAFVAVQLCFSLNSNELNSFPCICWLLMLFSLEISVYVFLFNVSTELPIFSLVRVFNIL